MNLGKKIKSIRLAEEMTQSQFSQLTSIPIGTLQNYENNKRTVNELNLSKISKNKQLKKYAYWLVTDDVIPDAGQVCPSFSILLHCGIIKEEIKELRA